jgi:hypothetical protein
MSPNDLETLVTRLQRLETTGRLDGMEIEYWVGGGHPPPSYRSEQFRWLTWEGRDTLEFATIAYAPVYEQPLTLKWQWPASPADVQAAARLLRETRVWAAEYTEEAKPPTADVIRTEVVVTRAGQEHKKVYYQRIPAELQSLQSEVKRLIDLVRAKSRAGVFLQGKPV